MRAASLRIGLACLVSTISCAASAAQESPSPLQLALSAGARVVHPMEALPLILTVTNLSASTVGVDDVPLHGEHLTDFAAIRTPSGADIKLHHVQNRLICIEGDSDRSVQIEPGASHEFHLLLGSGLLAQTAVFEDVGTYVIAIVFASAFSPPVTIECVAAPQQEESALELVRGLQRESFLNGYFDGRLLTGRHYQGRLQDLERLAWMPGSIVYANQARLALAERALWFVKGERDTARKPALFDQAQSLLEAVVPGSAIGHVGDATSHVGRRLADLRSERAASARSAR